MEDLGRHCRRCSNTTTTSLEDILPELTQYGICLPFRVAVVGQTNSDKTHSIMHRWLGGKILFWCPNNDDGMAVPTTLQHCLFCSNGGMSMSEKDTLVQHFMCNQQQQQHLFHMGWFPTKHDIFEFITRTSSNNDDKPPPPRKRQKKTRKEQQDEQDTTLLLPQNDPKDIAFNEDKRSTPSRVIVFDDLMTDAFGNRENEATMNLLTTKLSHHNNMSMLIVCHKLYPKGKNSMLFIDQLTGVHLHAIANQQKICRYMYGFLSDDSEKRQFDHLFNEHILRVNDSLKGNRRGSIFIHFTPGICQDRFGV